MAIKCFKKALEKLKILNILKIIKFHQIKKKLRPCKSGRRWAKLRKYETK